MTKFVAIFLSVISMVLGGGAAQASPISNDVVATQHEGAEVCFPFKDWGPAPVSQAPCDVLYRPTEDGSTILELGTQGTTIASCLIPNPNEENKRFVIKCLKQ